MRVAETARQEGDERYRLLVECVRDFAIFQLDPSGRITTWNAGAEDIEGYAAGEIIGRNHSVFFMPEQIASGVPERLISTALAHGSCRDEGWRVRKDGSRFWANVVITSLRGEDGEPIGFVEVTRDYTEKRNAEIALRQSEERFRSAFEDAGIGMALVGLDGRWQRVNRSICEMVGYSREVLLQKTFQDITHPDDLETDLAHVRELISGAKRTYQMDKRYFHSEGRIVWVRLTVSIVRDLNGQPVHFISQIEDITAQKEAEAERMEFDRKIQETQKLESLGVLAGGIAHDFNNILTSVLGNASIASIDPSCTPSVQRNLENIKKGTLRAADLCNQMLAYSGRGQFVVKNLSLNQLIEETTHLLEVSISKKAVLRFNLADALPAIEADATQMRQVIMNLVINASEAIGDQSGVISVNTGLTRVDRAYLGGTVLAPDLPEGTYVYLEVTDTGCGMSPETYAKIFDPFFTTKFAGRGLGLAAVLGIVRGHKGAIKAYSKLGRGTTFKLLFPAAAGAMETLAPAAPEVTKWRGQGCVLVVDDEETIRTTVALLLENLGFNVVLAADGREAVEVFRAEPDRFAMVLMDLTMPHLDGEQAFKELRRLRPDVKVVLMSGFNENEAISRFTGKGLASFLQKPFQFEGLSRIVRGVLSGAQWGGSSRAN